VALLALVLLTLPASAQPPAASIFPYQTVTETLDNGLEVILIPMSSGGLVAYWTVVRTGSRDEFETGRTGFAHFFEHMMFRGTERFPASVYNAKVTEIGADANAFTSDDLTAFHLSITKDDLDTVMDLESDRFQKLDYPEALFRTEAGAVYGEYRKNRASPFFTLFEALQAAAFTTHTYGHTAMGYEDDIKRMPELYDYSRGFFSRYYRPENVVLLIVGDLDPDATLDKVRAQYGAWPRGYQAPEIKPEPEQTKERRIQVAYAGSSLPILGLGYKVPAFKPDDRTYVAVDVLGDLLFGETSPLHKKLVLDEQVVEFLFANLTPNRDPSLMSITARVKDPEKVDYVLAEIDRTIEEAREKAVDAKRLAELKARRKYGFLMNLSTPSQVAGALARYIAVTGGIEAIDQVFATLNQITPADIQEAARTYLIPTRRTIAVLRGAS